MSTASVPPSTTPPLPPPTATALPAWAGATAFAVALAAVFAPTVWRLGQLWWLDPNYNHGFLVLPVAAGIGYLAFRKAGSPGVPDRRLGWLALALGGLCHLAAVLVSVEALDFLALFFLARGGLLFVGGRAWATAFTFPLAFLLFMFPLPPTWLSQAALWLQDVAARVSEVVLGLFVVCARDGHTIRIAGMDNSLVVAQECSGTRQIVAFVAMAALIGHFSGRSALYRWLLLLSSVPVAVAANVLRVVLMNLGAYWFGTKWMGGWMHDLPAVFSLPVGFLMFLFIDRALTRVLFGPPKTAADPATAGEPAPPPEPAVYPADFGRRFLLPAGVCAALIVAHLALVWHVSAADGRTYPPMAGTFDSLPLQFAPPDVGIPGWTGEEVVQVREDTRKKLPFRVDDLTVRVYQSSDGVPARLYMVHSYTGEDRKHHPEVCIRDVSGAPEDLTKRAKVALSADGREAQRFRFLTAANRPIAVYYWHYTLVPTAVASSPLQAIHQQIGTPPPSVTVQVTTNGDERSMAAAERTLLPQLDAAMQRTVLPPGYSTVGCDRLPIVFVR